MTLDEFGTQRCGRIDGVQAAGAVGQRLLDMGFLPDAEIVIERVAPAGEPLWVRVCGSQVALRRCEARVVRVRPGEPAADGSSSAEGART